MPRLRAIARDVLVDPLALTELFLLGNISFLAVDVAIAHAVNGFAHLAEWVPVAFSLVGAVMLFSAAILAGSVRPPLWPRASDARRTVGPSPRLAWSLGVMVGAGAIAAPSIAPQITAQTGEKSATV